MIVDSFRNTKLLRLQEINQICYDNLEQAIHNKIPPYRGEVVQQSAEEKDTVVTV
jgi:hypothetical protein